MSATITADRCNIESYKDSDHNQAIAQVGGAIGMFSCATAIRLVNCGPYSGSFWLARHKDNERDDYILMLPAPRWEQDARDAGWTLVQKLSARDHANLPTQ